MGTSILGLSFLCQQLVINSTISSFAFAFHLRALNLVFFLSRRHLFFFHNGQLFGVEVRRFGAVCRHRQSRCHHGCGDRGRGGFLEGKGLGIRRKQQRPIFRSSSLVG